MTNSYYQLAPEYRTARYISAARIISTTDFDYSIKSFGEDSAIRNLFEEAGVMHWFQKVEEGLMFDMGECKVSILEGHVYHKGENITTFVTNIVKKYQRLQCRKIENHPYLIGEISFNYVANISVKTLLSQWREVDKIRRSSISLPY